MALFRIYRGDKANLPGGWDEEKQTPTDTSKMKDGNAYFCADTGEFFIDVDLAKKDEPSQLKRVQINALAATKLSKGETTVEIDDLVLTSDLVVKYSGEATTGLQLNAVLVGTGTDVVKVIPATLGAFYVSDLETGPEFGIIPLTAGGTGGNDAETARANLEVYSTDEVDNKLKDATTVSYTTVLTVDDWKEDLSSGYVWEYQNKNLKCGAKGNVPPEITFTSNRDEYNDIDSAMAEPGVGINFYISEKPQEDIGIIIIDQL